MASLSPQDSRLLATCGATHGKHVGEHFSQLSLGGLGRAGGGVHSPLPKACVHSNFLSLSFPGNLHKGDSPVKEFVSYVGTFTARSRQEPIPVREPVISTAHTHLPKGAGHADPDPSNFVYSWNKPPHLDKVYRLLHWWVSAPVPWWR